jgi:serine-type D-Ala-D-Ala carboxypeptidase (penicillin-binding protein 5/6)
VGALALFCMLASLSCGGAGPTPTPVPTATPIPTPTPVPVVIQDQPLSAQVAYAVDLSTGAQLYDLNGDMPFAPASTMKIVTALLTRQLLDTDALVTITEDDLIDPTVYSTMGLEAGDEISVGDLLRGLLIPSGGDAGMALARAGGEALGASEGDAVARFVDELNAFALNAGMDSSHFSNPVGDDAPDEMSTARDLVRATALLLDDQLLTAIVQTAEAQVEVGGPDARTLDLINTNQLLAREDVFGVKTGSEDAAGQCLIAGFWRGDARIITVVLGSADRYADTTALIDAIDAAYQPLARAP